MTRSLFLTLGAAAMLALFSSDAHAGHSVWQNVWQQPQIYVNPGHAVTEPSLFDAVTNPTGLNPGDQYRIVFLRNAREINAESANVADYDAVIQSAVYRDINTTTDDVLPEDRVTTLFSPSELTKLGATWKAIVSTPTIDARDHTGTNPTILDTGHDVPIYMFGSSLNEDPFDDFDSPRLAINNALFWGSGSGIHEQELTIRETGSGEGAVGQPVMTGTLPDGTASANPMGGGTGLVSNGVSARSNDAWVDNDSTKAADDDRGWRLYGISSVITVGGPVAPDADYDADFAVDGADFLKWQRLGAGNSARPVLATWENNFGTTAAVSTVGAVPEPSSLLLASVMAAAMLARRRRLA